MMNDNQMNYLSERFRLCLERQDKMRIVKQCLVGSMSIFCGMAIIFALALNIPCVITSLILTFIFIIIKTVVDYKTKNSIQECVDEMNSAMGELL